MAIVNKIISADFADDQVAADIIRIQFQIYDNALSSEDHDYSHGFITYDFETNKPQALGLRDLAEVADVKLLIEAMAVSRAKNTLPLPALVSSTTVKDSAGSVTSYTERY